MTSLNYPSAGFVVRIFPFHFDFLAPLFDMRDVAPLQTFIQCRFTAISFISTQMMRASYLRFRTLYHDVIQRIRKQFHVVGLGSADDDRQWDSTAVYENASLGSFFFPDLWDLAPLPQLPAVPCSLSHRYFAISMQFLPSHRTRQGLLSKVFQINRQPAIQENTDGAHSHCQNALWVLLSIVSLYAKRTQFLQESSSEKLAFCLLRDRVHTSFSDSSVSWEYRVQPFPKIHRKSPMNTVVSAFYHPCIKNDKCQLQCQYYLWISS